MHAGPHRPEHEERRSTTSSPHRPDGGEPDSARRISLTVALVVTFLFLLVTAGGLGWFLSDGGPLGERATASGHDGEASGDTDTEEGSDGGSGPDGGAGTVTDSRAGLTYDLPGEGWRRLGDDEVPAEYSSYAVYGSADTPDAVIVTGSEDLGPLEPVAVSGTRMAVDLVGDLATGDGDLWAEPSGLTEVDGRPAFGATVGSDSEAGEDTYGRFLVVELDGDQGAFMLGLNTGGGAEATEGIEAAFDSVGTL